MDCPPPPVEHPSLELRQAVATWPQECLDALPVSARELADIPAGPPLPFKDTRDAYDVPESVESENFVVRWGSGVELDDVDGLLADLETAWAAQMGDQEYPGPPGTDSTKLNVYVGDSGGNTPRDLGAAGYYNVDDDGYPMLVVSLDTLADVDGRRHITTAHELFHAVQDGTGAYAFGTGERGAWWWEATAVQIVEDVYPGDGGREDYLLGWTFFPHLSADAFTYPDGVSLEPYHAYGAFVVADALGRADVRTTWVDAWSDVPLDMIPATTLLDVWTSLATWDVDERWIEAHDRDAERFPDDVMFSTEMRLDTWEVPDALPQDHGVSIWTVTPPADTVVTAIRFDGEDRGDQDSAVEWRLLAVRAGEVLEDPDEVEGSEPFVLIVGAFADTRVQDEGFPYRVRVEPRDRACGCSTGAPAWSWLVLLALIGRARLPARARARSSDAS